MTAFLQSFAGFAALAAIAALIGQRTRLPSGLAPLAVCSGAMVWLVGLGFLGFLRPAAWAVLALGAVSAVLVPAGLRREGSHRVLTPGFALFLAAGTVFVAYFAVRQPLPYSWDEFSLWGTAAKLTAQNGVIYSEAPIGWPWLGTQKAGLPTFSYLFTMFGEYASWRLYASYGVLYAAVWAAMAGSLRWKQWMLAAPTAVISFLLPYFTVYLRDIYTNYTYLDGLADVPMGAMMFGILAWYYHARRADAPVWPACLLIAALTLYKDTGLALACITAGILAVDTLFCSEEKPVLRGRVLAERLGFSAALFASTGAAFAASAKYIASVQAGVKSAVETSVTSVGGASEMSYVTMMVEGVRLLLGMKPGEAAEPFVERFAEVRSQMIDMFFSPDMRVTMVGCGLFVMILVWLMCFLAFGLAVEKVMRRRIALYAVLSTLGFWAYYIFIGFTYVFVFKSGITDYNRYIGTYYIAWVGGAAALLIVCAAGANAWRSGVRKICATLCLAASFGFLLTLVGDLSAARAAAAVVCAAAGVFLASSGRLFNRLREPAACLVLLLCAALLARYNMLVFRELCVIDYPDAVYSETARVERKAEAVKEFLGEDDLVYYVNSSDNGLGWFRTSYMLLPNILFYSHGGGDISASPDAGIHRSIGEFAAELAKCDYLYLDDASASFLEGYRALFVDGAKGYEEGTTYLYRIVVSEDAEYRPLTADEVADPETELAEDGSVLPSEPGQIGAFERMVMEEPETHLRLVPVRMEVPLL